MSQHDFDITTLDANTGPTMRAAINAALQAAVSNSSGATEPGATYPFMFWADTANNKLKQRNAANNAWIDILTLSTGQVLNAPLLGNATITNAKLAFDGGALSGFRNVIINGNFGINQRVYVSGAAVGAGLYGHDRWKMAASADTYTFSTTANVTTVTIPAGKILRQVVEGLNLQSGTYVLSWTGTAQGKIGAGSYGASGVTGSITGGTDTTIEFGPGTVSKVQLELGTVATPFEHRPIGTELALCQRYYQQHGDADSFRWFGISSGVGQEFQTPISFPVTMRTAPSCVTSGTWVVAGCSGPYLEAPHPTGFSLKVISTTATNWILQTNSADDFLTFSAEL
jgi:hypothetical protein